MLSPFHLRAEKARRRLYEFVVQARRVLEPGARFVDGTHVHAICEHLQAVTEGRIRNLIINVPPGHAKSLLTAVFWPAWVCKIKSNVSKTTGRATGSPLPWAVQQPASVRMWWWSMIRTVSLQADRFLLD